MEEQEKIQETTNDYGKYNAFIEKLKGTGYLISENHLCYMSKDNPVEISNFLPIIDEQIIYDNGKEVTIEYLIHAYLLDQKRELEQIRITKKELESFNFVLNSSWKLDAIISAGGHREKIREIAQIINRNTIKITKVYSNTGFVKDNAGKLNYLYHGGVIGDSKNVKVDLSKDKLQQYHFTEKEFDLKESLKLSFSIMNLASEKITIPLLAITYLAPLTTILNENGIPSDFILWLEGKTGSRKSSVTALMLSHFGNFTRNTFVASFRDTINALERKAYLVKDSLFVVDDYVQESISNRNQDIAEKLFALYGDRTARDRMSQNGQFLRGSFVARGQCIVTAESFPSVSESRLARCLIVDINQNSIDLKKLTELQNNKEMLAFCMKRYIGWIIENAENIQKHAKEIMEKLQRENQDNQVHGRMNESVNVLYIGFYMFLEFLLSNQIVNQTKKEKLLAMALQTLNEVAKEQMKDVENTDPVKMTLTAIEELYVTQRIHVRDYSISHSRYYGTHIGYVHRTSKAPIVNVYYYFFPDVLYTEIVKFYNSQNIKFPVSKASLWKYLDVAGLLYKTEGNDRRTIRKKIPGTDNTIPFIVIPMEKLPNITLEVPTITKFFS